MTTSWWYCSKICRRHLTKGNLYSMHLVWDTGGSGFHRVIVKIQKQSTPTTLQSKSLASNVRKKKILHDQMRWATYWVKLFQKHVTKQLQMTLFWSESTYKNAINMANILKIQQATPSSPETAGSRPQGWRMAPFLIGDALSTEMLCQEMKFICRGLKGQLVQLLLRWAWWLSTEKNTEKKCTKRMHRGQLMNGRGTDSARHCALQRKRKLFIRPGASFYCSH